ncbi:MULTISPECIES: hypothetical protein, partial [unclassified Paenibacillus]|uniref:hypothetical protein n=1 Tax=unclassified Paenibacillus TaxID=185978 RepID=UPI001A9B8BE5
LWCRGLTCLPVTQEIAGSNPVSSAIFQLSIFAVLKWEGVSLRTLFFCQWIWLGSSVGRAED